MGISFDRVADRFDETRAYPDEVMEAVIDRLARALDKSGRVLDLGVGTGRFALPLQRMDFAVVGVDISRMMIAKALEKGTEDVVMGDVCQLPFADGAFDQALSVHVLHLVAGWRGALSEVARVTKNDLISVAFNKDDSEAEEFRKLYEDSCTGLGHEVAHPGVRERELPGVLKPDEEIDLLCWDHLVDVETLLSNYEARTFSNQWDVPDRVHELAIETLRSRYQHVEQVLSRERISILRWKANRLRGLTADIRCRT